jgi:hypothetical protein
LFLEFGRKFLFLAPDATTGLLCKLCTGDYHSLLPLTLPSSTSESSLISQNKLDEKEKEKGKEIGKDKKEKGKEKDKERGRVVGKEVVQIPVPIDEIISLFSGYENYLLQLVKTVGEKLGNKGSEKLGNTTLELYLEKYDLLRTYDDNVMYERNDNINNNNNNNNENEKEKDTENKRKNIENENNREIKNIRDSECELSKEDLLAEKNANVGLIEEKIMALLDGNLPYDRYDIV